MILCDNHNFVTQPDTWHGQIVSNNLAAMFDRHVALELSKKGAFYDQNHLPL